MRIAVSAVIVFHLFAVIIAPMSVPPTSNLIMEIAQGTKLQLYLDALYINHGYAFFAPDPGSGKIVHWEIMNTQGAVIQQGEFPNSKEQWPRLWYHRHFMLADQLGIGAEDERDPNLWKRRFLEGYARHLLRESDGEMIRVRYFEHMPLDPELALQGAKLDDPSTYKQVLPDVVVRRSDLGPADSHQTDIWQSDRQNVAGPPNAGNPWTRGTR
ncbi:MAG: hypothetical protein WD468_00420 [Pirellulales bacterium]